MFGILRPCARHSCPRLHQAWRAHLCGMCLTLRDRHGQLARAATNYDGLVLSVLTEAQRPESTARRVAGPCPLRGFRRAEVVSSRAEGARLAAAVSLALASGKIRDHAADGDGTAGRRFAGAPLRLIAGSWTAAAGRGGGALGFDTSGLVSVPERQAERERTPGLSLLDLTEPTETAVAAAFAHTATLARTPHNAEALREAGRLFGRIAHLLDAVEDLDDDVARGAFNPLAATGTTLSEARRLCDDALHGLRLAVADLDLEERHLAEALLVDETRRAIARTFGHRALDPHTGHPTPEHRAGAAPDPVRGALAGMLTFLTCGLYRPSWSRLRDESWDDRCYAGRCDGCDGCDGCCDCADCCGRCCGSGHGSGGGSGAGEGGGCCDDCCCDCDCGCGCD
nr:DUF5685 family protein [Microtetraspora sp. NBRC 16547]